MSTGINCRMSWSCKAVYSYALLLLCASLFLEWPPPLPASSTSKIVDSGCCTAKCHDNVRFSVHSIFLPVHCSLCRHCWMHFNQAQWGGGGWVLRPATVMYWHCQGLCTGMHATGWHSSLIQCCCHMESILLQQYQIQPTSHPLDFKCNRPFFCQWFSYKCTWQNDTNSRCAAPSVPGSPTSLCCPDIVQILNSIKIEKSVWANQYTQLTVSVCSSAGNGTWMGTTSWLSCLSQ